MTTSGQAATGRCQGPRSEPREETTCGPGQPLCRRFDGHAALGLEQGECGKRVRTSVWWRRKGKFQQSRVPKQGIVGEWNVLAELEVSRRESKDRRQGGAPALRGVRCGLSGMPPWRLNSKRSTPHNIATPLHAKQVARSLPVRISSQSSVFLLRVALVRIRMSHLTPPILVAVSASIFALYFSRSRSVIATAVHGKARRHHRAWSPLS